MKEYNMLENKYVMKEFKALCSRLKQLTWDNEHTQAKIEIANYFRLDKHYRVFKAIEQISDVEGYLPSELSEYRRRKSVELLEAVKQKRGEEIYQQVYNSL